jgi:hypothetical protein
LSAPWPIEENMLKGEMGNDSDLREQILEAAEEEDVSGQLLQQAASKKGKPLSETRFDSPSAIIANNSKSMNRCHCLPNFKSPTPSN